MFTQTGTTANLLFPFYSSLHSHTLTTPLPAQKHTSPLLRYLYLHFSILIEARMAEWSKAVVSGTILFGGVGSNPTPCIFFSPSPSDFHQIFPRVSRSKRMAAFYTLLLPLSPETVWPSGLRRVTRNHFSSGGVGSNPAAVVFLFRFLLFRLRYDSSDTLLKLP